MDTLHTQFSFLSGLYHRFHAPFPKLIWSPSQSHSQSFVPLDQQSDNESSESIFFEIKIGNNLILVIRFTAQSQSASMACYGAFLKWSQSSRFLTAGQRERGSGNEIVGIHVTKISGAVTDISAIKPAELHTWTHRHLLNFLRTFWWVLKAAPQCKTDRESEGNRGLSYVRGFIRSRDPGTGTRVLWA